MDLNSKLNDQLCLLYPGKVQEILSEINEKYGAKPLSGARPDMKSLTEEDVVLITYGDMVTIPGKTPLNSLRHFMETYSKGVVNTIHILPCFPYTSDDGFSVVDYKSIDPNLGNWDDIAELSIKHDLMLDAVVNHTSSQHNWFQQYLAGDSEYQDYFIEGDKAADYSSVTRPRDLPLLTPFETSNGEKWLWTTFSDDQIDLNFASHKVFLEVLDILISYAKEGARFIRLDAVGFIWKKQGTSCMHLPETHAVIQVLKGILEQVVPGTKLITETNVPHEDNISYFGNGGDEADLVYQFPLPPLVFHSLVTGDASALTRWAKNLESPPGHCSFFNFLASHDGIGVRPVEGLLSPNEIENLAQTTLDRGGRVSWKRNSDGSKSIYELNITYRDAVSPPDVDLETKVRAMIAAHAILLAFQGVPAVYFNSFVGSGNDYDGLEKSGINRRINRQKFSWEELVEQLESEEGINHKIWDGLVNLIKLRRKNPCFSPTADQTVEEVDPSVFCITRFTDSDTVRCLVNVSSEKVLMEQPLVGYDLISQTEIYKTALLPYETVWCKEKR